MPQFDKVSFFTQIFWLVLVFFSFYMLLLKIFIPSLSRIIKTRIKKLQLGEHAIHSLQEEKATLFITSEEYINKKIQILRDFGSKNINTTISWLDDSIKTTNKNLNSNNSYIKNILQISGKNSVLQKLF